MAQENTRLPACLVSQRTAALKVILLARLGVTSCTTGLTPFQSSQEQGGALRVRIMGVFGAY